MTNDLQDILIWLRTSGSGVLVILIASLLLIRLLRAVSDRIPRLMPAEEGPAIIPYPHRVVITRPSPSGSGN